MSHYNHLLSPLRIGNVMLKSRMVSGNALPHYLQGPETFPAESVIHHIAGIARNGAAIITFADWTDPNQRHALDPSSQRFPSYDLNDPSVLNYISQLADAAHFYDSKIAVGIMEFGRKGWGVRNKPALDMSKPIDLTDMAAIQDILPQLFAEDFDEIKAMNAEQIDIVCDDVAQRCLLYKKLGFDMCTLHMAYRLPIFAQFLSPITNNRTDAYGGSLENRARFPLEACRRIKKLCGQDFLIEIEISGEEDGDGMGLDEVIAFAKMAEGLIDIFQIRASNDTDSHPTGFNSVEGLPITLRYAEAIKKSGAKVFVEPIGGYQDPDLNEQFLAQGKCDLIGMARTFICEPQYYEKLWQGRGEDVVPCIRCNKCHVPFIDGPWYSVCSVNPALGLAHRLPSMVSKPGPAQRVAVIGGGPAGIMAATVAAGRGHDVTLYEKSMQLGGQLTHAIHADFKWPIRNFLNWQVRQLEKSGAKVCMGTEAIPEMIQAAGYDIVIVALGPVPNIPPIPGARGKNVYSPLDVYGNHQGLGERVVVVGGAETGTETGLYLAVNGHQVTVLTRQEVLAPDAAQVHYVEMLYNACKRTPNFHAITRVTTTEIREGAVVYRDAEGMEHRLPADSVVLSGGMNPQHEKAAAFFGTADRFFAIGDCNQVGCIQTCMRSAFATAMQF